MIFHVILYSKKIPLRCTKCHTIRVFYAISSSYKGCETKANKTSELATVNRRARKFSRASQSRDSGALLERSTNIYKCILLHRLSLCVACQIFGTIRGAPFREYCGSREAALVKLKNHRVDRAIWLEQEKSPLQQSQGSSRNKKARLGASVQAYRTSAIKKKKVITS